MSGATPHPDPGTIRRALGVLQRLPAEALADLTERLIDQLDALTPDPDSEPEEDRCDADDEGVLLRGALLGDEDDAEDSPVAPRPCLRSRLRAERDGIVRVYRRSAVIVRYEHGVPVRAQAMRLEAAG